MKDALDNGRYYHTLIEIYDDSAPDTLLEVLHSRVSPTCLTELRAHGAGSFIISKSDPKILENPSLIDYRKYVKIRMNGVVVGGFVIQTKKTQIVGEGEEAEEVWEISGEGGRSWSRDAVVYPAKGLKATSADTRYFNFAVEQGSWYNASDWVNATQIHKWNAPGGRWKTNPAEWPDAPNAYWIWDRASSTMPQGYVYFRKEFTVTEGGNYSFFFGLDDRGEVYLDGELLYTTSEWAFTTTNRIDMELEAGDHVLGIKGYNYKSNGPGGLIGVMFKYGDPTVPSSATIQFVTDSSWKINAYPDKEPGWKMGDVLLTLLSEAETRGVRFAQNWTPTFTEDLDSSGEAWPDPIPWSFGVGSTYEDAISAIEELGCDIYLDPDTLELHAWKKRGINREETDNPVILLPGKNLISATETGQAQIANTLMLHSKEGWSEKQFEDSTSLDRYGRVESQISTELSASGSEPLVQEIFQTKALPEKSATFEFVPTEGCVPFVDFNVGDWILAPGEVPGVLESRRVMSISFREDNDTGVPQFSVEFDTIFKDRQAELEKWVSRLANSSAISGSFTNTSALPPTTQHGQPGTPLGSVPDAPTGLIVSSVGHFAEDGSSSADYGLTWNPVVSGSGFGDVDVTEYEVWGRRTTETESQYFSTVFDTFAYLQGFRSGDEWAFKVRAISRTGGPGDFSTEVTLVAANPVVALGAPSTPTLSSSKGVVTIYWDGLIDGDPAPGFVRYLRVERKTAGTTGTWEEVRRNIFQDPRATALTHFSSSGGTDVALSTISDMPAPTTTGVRSTRLDDGEVRLIDLIVGTEFEASTMYRLRMRIRSSDALTTPSVVYRPDLNSSSGEVSADTQDIPSGESYIDVTFTTSSTSPTSDAGITIIHDGTGSTTLDVTDILIEKAPSDGTMVAGDIESSDPLKRYRWLGDENDSISVYEENDPWITVGTMVRNSTTDASVTVGKSYDYRFIAIDTYGGESDPSDEASITVTGVLSGDITGGLASQNLVANGSFEDGMANWMIRSIYPNGGAAAEVIDGGLSGAKYLRLTRGVEIPGGEVELSVAQSEDSFIPISSVGEFGYFVSAKAASSAPVTGGFTIRVYWYQGDKETPASTAVSTVTDVQDVDTTAQYYVGQVFPPEDARFMQVAVISSVPNTTVYVDDVIAREVISQNMIGQNAITAEHLSAGSVTANALQAGSVTADALAAESITADKIGAGEIQTSHLAADVGASLDISSNASVNILINRTDTLEDDLDGVQGAVTDLQTYYSFTSEGAIIGKTDSAFKLFLKNDRIEILENGVVVSYWDSGQMVVKRFLGEEVVLANHKIEKYGTGTVVKKI